jgi:multidrug efflux system membrane fusion protein
MRASYVIAAVIAVAAGVWIYSGQLDGEPEPVSAAAAPPPGSNAPAAKDAPLFKVRVSTRQAEQRVSNVVVLGRTEESRRVRLSAETAGQIVAIGAAKGERVHRGDLIARIAMKDRKAWLEMAETRVEQREMEYQAALELAQRNFRSKTGLAASAAELAAAKAEVEARKTDIAHTEIRAPFDGVLETRAVEIGDFVKVEAPVATIVDLSPIVVVGHVTETDVGRLSIGNPAGARLVTGRDVAGEIRYIAAVADPASRTFRVEIEVPNGDGEVVAGLTAELRLPQERVLAHRVSPAVLTLNDLGQVGIKAIDGDNRVTFHTVTLVADGSDGMWLGGLPETVTVITVGQEFVTVGQKVHPIHEEAITVRREGRATR